MKMNKRGVDIPTVSMIFALMAVLIVGGLAFRGANLFAKEDTIIKVDTIEDVQMMVNTLVGVPGDAVVKYSKDISSYTLILTDNNVVIFKKGEAESKRIRRYFFLPEGYTARGIVEEKSEFCITKEKKNIFLGECKDV